VNDFEIEPMLKSVAVVIGACAASSRKPYPFSSTMLPSLISARAAPGTLCVDMKRSISASEAEKSAADTEAASVTMATAILTAHAASGRPHQLRFIVVALIITIKFRGAPCGAEVAAVKTGRLLRAAEVEGCFSRLYRPRANSLFSALSSRSSSTDLAVEESGVLGAGMVVLPLRSLSLATACSVGRLLA
jgi:hypothetical protein